MIPSVHVLFCTFSVLIFITPERKALVSFSETDCLNQFQSNVAQGLRVKGIQIYLNEGQCSFSKKDNSGMAKKRSTFKNLFIQNHWSNISTNRGSKLPWVKRFKCVEIRGHTILQGEKMWQGMPIICK